MLKIVSTAQMRRAEESTEATGTSTAQLMQNAGAAAAQVIVDAVERGGSDARVLVLCGPGNNGGDGLVVAERLAEWGHNAAAYTIARAQPPQARTLVIRHEDDEGLVALHRLLDSSMVVVDALLGTGRSRPIQGGMADVLDAVRNTIERHVIVALDLPSGVDADTGAADPRSLQAAVTITLGYLKRGLLLGRGAELAGHIVTAPIGLAADTAVDVQLWQVSDDDVRAAIPKRGRQVNKYTAGAVLIVAGSERFTGAPQLAAMGAARSGAGLVTIATGASTHPILAANLLEPTYLLLADDGRGDLDPEPSADAIRQAAGRYRALLFGPGLARSDHTVRLLELLLFETSLPDALPVVLDAEGLNALAKIDRWAERIRRPLVLTPHAGEMARLSGGESADIDARRFDVAPEKAREWGVVLVLKGNPTVTAGPDGSAAVNSTGGPNLATAGSGDVLGGMIASLIAQGARAFDAAVAGVYLHGRSGDVLAESHGDRGTLSQDLLDQIPAVIKSVRTSA